MPFHSLPKTQPKQLAMTLVQWLNDGGRCPAIFRDEFASDRRLAQLLHDYVDSWLAAGCRLKRWKLRRTFEQVVKPLRLSQSEGEPVRTTTDWSFYSRRPGKTASAAAEEVDAPVPDDWKNYEPPSESEEEWDEEREEAHAIMFKELTAQATTEKAAQIFLSLITSRYYCSIGRCARCQRLYVNISNQAQKKYCSQRCASFDSSARSSKKQRQERQQHKVIQLKRAAEKLSRLSDVHKAKITDLKDWLSKEAGVSRHFITRALNQGLLELRSSPLSTTIKPRKGKRT